MVTGDRVRRWTVTRLPPAGIGQTCGGLLGEIREFSDWLDNEAPRVAERYLTLETEPPTTAAALPTG